MSGIMKEKSQEKKMDIWGREKSRKWPDVAGLIWMGVLCGLDLSKLGLLHLELLSPWTLLPGAAGSGFK